MSARGTAALGMIALPGLRAGAIAQETTSGRNSAILYMIKHPTESDFEVRISEDAIEVIFKRTSSQFTYARFVEPKDIVEFGPLSPDPGVRHAGRSGDTGTYRSPEVRAMAFRLALEAARRK
jgi:hypothetical protein